MGQPGETVDKVVVRNLRPEDLEAVIEVDARTVGRRREEFFKIKLQQNLAETGVKVSLAAEMDGVFCGFLLARVFYGEFGMTEPSAVLETMGVHPAYQRKGVGRALIRQLHTNLHGLGVAVLQTEVGWDNPEVLAFFHRQGFRPAERFCLDLDLREPPRDEDPA